VVCLGLGRVCAQKGCGAAVRKVKGGGDAESSVPSSFWGVGAMEKRGGRGGGGVWGRLDYRG